MFAVRDVAKALALSCCFFGNGCGFERKPEIPIVDRGTNTREEIVSAAKQRWDQELQTVFGEFAPGATRTWEGTLLEMTHHLRSIEGGPNGRPCYEIRLEQTEGNPFTLLVSEGSVKALAKGDRVKATLHIPSDESIERLEAFANDWVFGLTGTITFERM